MSCELLLLLLIIDIYIYIGGKLAAVINIKINTYSIRLAHEVNSIIYKVTFRERVLQII